MKKKKRIDRKIGTKVVTLCACVLSVILVAAFAFIILQTAQTSKSFAANNITALDESGAATIKAALEVPLDTARAIAHSMQGYEEISVGIRRDFYNSVMKSVLEANAGIVGVWACWEPDALDGLDSEYANTEASDGTGRFIPSWQRMDGGVVVAPLVDYQRAGAGDYYLRARDTGRETILEPYVYEIGGERVLLTTLSVPIKGAHGQTVGVVGVDIALSDLQGIAFDDGGFESANTYALSYTDTYIIHPNADMVGTAHAKEDQGGEEALTQATARGESYQTDSASLVTGAKVNRVYVPVRIGETTTPWSIVVEVDNAEVMAATTQMSILLIVILVFVIVVITVALHLIVKAMITKPLRETANLAKALASGELDTKVDIKSNDEIGQLKGVLDVEVRNAFKSVAQAQVVAEKQRRYQGEQVERMVVNLERLARGELYCDMAVSEADEDTQEIHALFTNIGDNLHLSVNAIKGYIEELSRVLGEIAAKNLRVGITAEYRGDFAALKDSINGISKALNAVMLEINASAGQVASGTQHVSSGAEEISQGAAEQAGTIEELTATITQIAEQTKLNAASANEASRLTEAVKGDAGLGNEQMKAMQLAMEEINEASENIGKIIKVIDDIAFQTNILALNAAVEAARAGAHGKGFAVVAEEVRNLAARSADAARETTELIEGSIRKAEAGTRIANETAQALVHIVDGVDNSARIIADIASASNEQATAIVQVNQGIEQLSHVVQGNSATAEQAAAAAQELSSQAEMLRNMVGQFRLLSMSGAAHAQPAKAGTAGPSTRPDVPPIRLSDTDFGKF
jgi:methyl-accepting chemotaxis protein